jgi:hypothetical protein
MQVARFVRAMVFLVGFGLAGAVASCGPGAPQGPTAEDKERGKIIKEGNRKFYKQLKESAKADAGRQGGAMKRGKFRSNTRQ